MRQRFLWLLPVAMWVGCGEGDSPPAVAPETPAVEAAAEPATTAAPALSPEDVEGVELMILSYDEIQDLIRSHQGKVVVMDAWSTSCPPCVAEFPNLVALSKKYPDQVACISLSFDYEGIGKPEEVQEKVLNFLIQQKATFENVLSNEESDVLYKKFDLVAVPAVFIYDTQGNLIKQFDNSTGEEFTYADVEKYLVDVLNPPAAK